MDSENSTYLNVNLSLHDSTDIVRDLEDACSLAEVTNVINFSASTSEVAGRISDKVGLNRCEFKFTPEDARNLKIRTSATTQYFFDIFILKHGKKRLLAGVFLNIGKRKETLPFSEDVKTLTNFTRVCIDELKLPDTIVHFEISYEDGEPSLISCRPGLENKVSQSLLYAFASCTSTRRNSIYFLTHLLAGQDKLPEDFQPQYRLNKFSLFQEFQAFRKGQVKFDLEDFYEPACFSFLFTCKMTKFYKKRDDYVEELESVGHVVCMHRLKKLVVQDMELLDRYEEKIQPFILKPLNIVLIIQPRGGTDFLCREFSRRAVHCLAVSVHETRHTCERPYPVNEELFEKIFHVENENWVSSLKEQILHEGFKIDAVIPGTRSAVIPADEFSDILNLRSNGVELSRVRTSNLEIHERLKRHNLKLSRQKLCYNIHEAQMFAENILSYPCIVKSGSRVFQCFANQDLHAAVARSPSPFVCGEYLHGTKYICEYVSLDRKHHLSLILQEKKQVSTQIYKLVEEVKYDSNHFSLVSRLRECAKRVLDVLQIRNGPSRVEMIVTEGEVCFVKLSTTLDEETCLITEQVSGLENSIHYLTADVYVNEGRELTRRAELQSPYKIKQHCRVVYLSCPQFGFLKQCPRKRFLNDLDLKTLKEVKFHFEVGDRIGPAEDTKTCSGTVFLFSSNPKFLDEDILQLQKYLDSHKLYSVSDNDESTASE